MQSAKNSNARARSCVRVSLSSFVELLAKDEQHARLIAAVSLHCKVRTSSAVLVYMYNSERVIRTGLTYYI